MITRFKIFENSNPDDLEIGDYVLFNINTKELEYSEILNNFINNNFGIVRVINRYHTNNKIQDIKVEYFNPPKEIIPWFAKSNYGKFIRTMLIENLVDYDKDPDRLELKIASKKYNL